MSHISKIKTMMVDKDLVLKALDQLGFTYQLGKQYISGMAGKKVAVNITIHTRLGNDIGLRKIKGSYEVVADWWGVLGTNQEEFSNRLSQQYALLAVTSRMQKQGFSMVSEENDQGKIHLVLRKMS